MGEAGEAKNITHQQKKIAVDAIRRFRDRFDMPVPDDKLEEVPYVKFEEGSPELEYMRARRQELGGYLPAAAPAHAGVARGPAARGVRAVPQEHRGPRDLDHDGVRADPAACCPRQEPRQAHRADRARRVAHVRHGGDVPAARDLEPASASSTRPRTPTSSCSTRRTRTARSCRRASTRPARCATGWRRRHAYSTHGVPMIPFYIFYSMFGFQRVGDLAWAAGDMRCARLPARRHGGPHDAERRGAAARGRPLARVLGDDPELHLLRSDVRLRGRGHHPGRPAPHVRGAAGRLLLPDRDERELRASGHARRAPRRTSSRACTCSSAARPKQRRRRACSCSGRARSCAR